MVGATINGMIAPIDRVPQTGDIVEIITSSASRGPSRDWLKLVKTGEARNKIRQWFKKEKRTENIAVGRSELDREFSKFRVRPKESEKAEIVASIAKRLGMHEPDDLYNAIGYGGLPVSKITAKLKEEYEKVVRTPEDETPVEPEQINTQTPDRIRSSGGVIVDGEYGCAVKFAKCCNPLPGDRIVGFITKGYGVSVHKHNCKNIVSGMKDPAFRDRLVNVAWDEATSSDQSRGLYEASIRIFADNTITILADGTGARAERKVTLVSVNTKKRTEDDVTITITVGCRNNDHYNSIVSRLRTIPHVRAITRGNG